MSLASADTRGGGGDGGEWVWVCIFRASLFIPFLIVGCLNVYHEHLANGGFLHQGVQNNQCLGKYTNMIQFTQEREIF